MSSRPAAVTAWLTAAANRSPSTVPATSGISGSAGYSVTGMVCRLNRELPQVTRQLRPVEHHIDRFGRQRSGDVGQQPAGDEDLAVVGDIGRESSPVPRSRSRNRSASGRPGWWSPRSRRAAVPYQAGWGYCAQSRQPPRRARLDRRETSRCWPSFLASVRLNPAMPRRRTGRVGAKELQSCIGADVASWCVALMLATGAECESFPQATGREKLSGGQPSISSIMVRSSRGNWG